MTNDYAMAKILENSIAFNDKLYRMPSYSISDANAYFRGYYVSDWGPFKDQVFPNPVLEPSEEETSKRKCYEILERLGFSSKEIDAMSQSKLDNFLKYYSDVSEKDLEIE